MQKKEKGKKAAFLTSAKSIWKYGRIYANKLKRKKKKLLYKYKNLYSKEEILLLKDFPMAKKKK